MVLADARARLPALEAIDHDAARDAAFLVRIAEACLAFTPLVAIEPPDGLCLDVTGCLHLFGGARGLITRIDAFLAGKGIGLRAALAPTPDMARALARFGAARLAIARSEARASALSVAALEAGEEVILALKRAGLTQLGDLAARASAILVARFGAALTEKLARVLGREDRRIVPWRIPPPYVIDHRAAEPVLAMAEIERIIALLAEKAGALMEARGEGGRAFEAVFFRTDGAIRAIAIETGRPMREAGAILRLFKTRLEALADPIDPGFGFDAVRFCVTRSEAVEPPQISLEAREAGAADITGLIDRLVARFGRGSIQRLAAVDSHDPARAQAALPALDAGPGALWPVPEAGEPPLRPLTLFEPPHPIEVMAEIPEGPPRHFRWRRARHDIRLAEGPERIAAPWWGEDVEAATRDYYRVEDAEGRRFWVFRAGLYGEAAAGPRWFLHGLFA